MQQTARMFEMPWPLGKNNTGSSDCYGTAARSNDTATYRLHGLVTSTSYHRCALAQSAGFRRLTSQRPAKAKATMKLERFLPERGTVYLDGSTTMLGLIDRLQNGKRLQVATNNVETFRSLDKVPGVEPLLIGGRLDPRTDNLVGDLTSVSNGCVG